MPVGFPDKVDHGDRDRHYEGRYATVYEGPPVALHRCSREDIGKDKNEGMRTMNTRNKMADVSLIRGKGG